MPIVTRTDLKALAGIRFKDASLLYSNRRYSSAYYLAGYAIELALKAVIVSHIIPNTLPEKNFVNQIYTHKLENLLKLSGLDQQFATDSENNLDLRANWAITADWSEESRYEQIDQFRSKALLDAIGADPSGVFTWLQKHW